MANIKIDSFKIKAKNGDTYELSADTSALAGELNELKEQVASGGGSVDLSEYIKKEEIDEFDTEAYKQEVAEMIDTAKADLLTIDKFDEFNAGAYKEEVANTANEIIENARAELLTIDKFDEFDTEAYKNELNAIITEARSEFAILDSLDEIDIQALKAEIKAEILAELGGV